MKQIKAKTEVASDFLGRRFVFYTEIQSHQLFYYISKSEVGDNFFFTVIVITKKIYAVPEGDT